MIPVLAWILRRLWCFLTGHDWDDARLFDVRMAMKVDGHECDRCGKLTAHLPRWAR